MDDVVLLEAPGELSPRTPAHGEITQGVYVPQTYDESFDAYHARFDEPLSDREQAHLDELRASSGKDVKWVQAGRMIIEDDVYRSVDDVLTDAHDAVQATGTIEKGSTWRLNVTNPRNDTSIPPFTRLTSDGIFEARKPWFGMNNQVKIIVPNALVRDIMQLAVNEVVAAADDCITSGTLSVILRSDWDALGVAQAPYAAIFVYRGSQASACPFSDDAVHGCAVVPLLQNMAINWQGGFQNRIAPGYAIGLVDTSVTGTDESSVATATHELLHTLGLGHTYGDQAIFFPVPGTAGVSTPTSIMRPRGTTNNPPCLSTDPCAHSLHMSPDDKFSLDTLYSPQPGAVVRFRPPLRRLAR